MARRRDSKVFVNMRWARRIAFGYVAVVLGTAGFVVVADLSEQGGSFAGIWLWLATLPLSIPVILVWSQVPSVSPDNPTMEWIMYAAWIASFVAVGLFRRGSFGFCYEDDLWIGWTGNPDLACAQQTGGCRV